MRSFVDNVARIVIEHCLIKELKSLLNPITVDAMDDDLLAKLAAESDDVREEREEQTARLQILKKGLHTCEAYEHTQPTRTCSP
jgi:hypothetical protein